MPGSVRHKFGSMVQMRTADYLHVLGIGHIFLGILAFLVQIGGKHLTFLNGRITTYFIFHISLLLCIRSKTRMRNLFKNR